MKPTALMLTCVGVLACCSFANAAEQIRAKTIANHVVEIDFASASNNPDPFNNVTLDAVFTESGNPARERRVPAFWAGGSKWKVRYASPTLGMHPFHTECSDKDDTGLQNISGVVEIEAYKGDNPLYVHGPVRVSKDKRYMEHVDGTPFLWTGDTWWMSLTKRLSYPDEFNALLADRKKKGFNLVQIIAGLYPDMPAFDERGANEAGFPWEKDYSRIRPEYFDKADERMNRLVEEGVVPCIVGAWGYHLPYLGLEKMKRHERYVYARWGALPMVWCAAGEFNMPFYLAPGFPAGGPKQAEGWADVIAYMRTINAFDRIITGHPTGIAPMAGRGVLPGADKLLDVDMLQTGHGQLEVVPLTVNAVRYSLAQKPPMPVVNAEPSYEMLLDKTPAEIARAIFWISWCTGVKGYTYGANGIWQLNGRDKPYGNSPWGGNYGKISWQDAMNLAGSAQVGLGKKLLEQYPWQKLEPQPNAVAWAENKAMKVPLGEWIWLEDGAAEGAPVGTRFFRKGFEIPAGAKVKQAVLRVAADDRATVWLNGEQLGSTEGWESLHEFNNFASKLKAGSRNLLAIRAENVKANVPKNPAGLIGGLAIELEDGGRIEVRTSVDWRASSEEATWQKTDLDDSKWAQAKIAAPYGEGPWGKIGTPGANEYLVPYSMGIPRELRIIYVYKPGAVHVKELEDGVKYHASHFDPTSGERHDIGDVVRDAQGTWKCETPAGVTHDWVLILEPK